MQAVTLTLCALVLLASATLCVESAGVLAYYSTSRAATGTWYQANTLQTGHCSIPTNDMDLQTVAVETASFMGGAICGMCLQITANGTGAGTHPIEGPMTVLVADSCPTCDPYGIDFRNPSAEASWGAWKISWVAVDCPVGSHKFTYQFQGSNAYYVKIKIVNPLIPVASAQAMTTTGTWVDLTLTSDGWFAASSGITYKANPMNIKVKSVQGETVTDTINVGGSIPTATRSSVYSGSAQFSQGGGGGKGTGGSGDGDGSSAALLTSWLSSARS